MTTDALGNPVVVGHRYGYTQSSNGLTHVVIGICRKAEDGRASIEVTKRQYCGGNPEGRTNDALPTQKISVRGIMLFPVGEFQPAVPKTVALDLIKPQAMSAPSAMLPIEARRNMREIGEGLVGVQLPPSLSLSSYRHDGATAGGTDYPNAQQHHNK